MTDRLTELLGELGKIFQLSLHTDKYNACSISIPPLVIQLQLDSTQEKLFLFSKIFELPPGKFREIVLREALNANGLPDPRPGVFGYIAASNHLALHQRYPLEILNGERLAGLFGSFYELAELWHKALASGQSAPPSTAARSPFGLKP
jgi:hypothetical protein